ncbi:MAG: TIGR00341 family protein [Spirosomataceae bacterium]
MKTLLTKTLNDLFHILDTTDAQKTIKEISSGVSMRGYNLWILICSAMLASIGLDTNSTAVIIGAMLISPLMSPILGVGLGLSINDQDLLFRSLRNLTIATIASLTTSTLYFLLSPLSEPTAEEMARTQPTLLDVGIALFGGVAGIIAGSRTEKNNAIPGVAIATALMPPVCTAGFGLAHGDWKVFGGAFYLFAINAVFISLSTFGVAKYLRFPLKEYMNETVRKQVRNSIYVALVVTLLPSIYFLYTVYEKNQEKKIVTTQVVNEIVKQGNEVLKWEINHEKVPTLVKIYYSGKSITAEQIDNFKKTLAFFGLPNYEIQITRMNLSREEISEMSNEAVQNLVKTLTVGTKPDIPEEICTEVMKEIQTLYPDIKRMGINEITIHGGKTDTITQVLMGYDTKKVTSEALTKINGFLKVRLKKDTLLIQSL